MLSLFLRCLLVQSAINANKMQETSDYHGHHLINESSNGSRKIPGIMYGTQQLFIGFANDPFGPSKVKNKSTSSTMKTLHYSRKNRVSQGAFESDQRASRNSNRTSEIRPKRGVFQLYNMVSCATGCNPLIYKGYGCYCGFLGSGYAVDGIDRCCKMHDWCYDRTKCPIFLGYFMPYYWKCYNNNRPICAVLHGEYGSRNSCAGELCECDRKLSECLKKFPCPNSRALCRSAPLRLLQNTLMII